MLPQLQGRPFRPQSYLKPKVLSWFNQCFARLCWRYFCIFISYSMAYLIRRLRNSDDCCNYEWSKTSSFTRGHAQIFGNFELARDAAQLV